MPGLQCDSAERSPGRLNLPSVADRELLGGDEQERCEYERHCEQVEVDREGREHGVCKREAGTTVLQPAVAGVGGPETQEGNRRV